MSCLLNRLSAFFFYLLGSTFLVAVVLLKNQIGGIWPAWWMQVADLPLIFSAVVFGGTSLYRSLTRPERPSEILAACIGVPLGALFLFAVYLNFTNVWW